MKTFSFSKQVRGVRGVALPGSILIAGTRSVRSDRETPGRGDKVLAGLRDPARTLDLHGVSLRSLERTILREDTADGRRAQNARLAKPLTGLQDTMETFRSAADADWPGVRRFLSALPAGEPSGS